MDMGIGYLMAWNIVENIVPDGSMT